MQPLIRIVLLFALAFCGETPYVLMVSFDGFRYDYADSVDTPNFDFTAENGVKAESLIPVFPSLTFPNHYSIATGAYAGTHNITGNSFYDKKFKEKYSLYDRETVRDGKFYHSEPIWVTAERQGIKTASYFWVGTEAPIKGMQPSIFKYYDGDVLFSARIDSVISWFNLPEERRPQLIMLYFSEPDYSAHIWGPTHPEVFSEVEALDSLLGELLKKLKALEIYPELNIFLVSDHGMAEVSSERLIILDDYITRKDDIYINGKGAIVQFDLNWGKKNYGGKLLQELKKIPNSRAFSNTNIPQRFHFINHNTGDFLLLADEGWLITTRESLEEKKSGLKGMHGYDPRYPNMQGIFYAMGSEIKAGLTIPAFENIHIYPLICEILKIIPYNGEDDAAEGELEVLQPILKDQ